MANKYDRKFFTHKEKGGRYLAKESMVKDLVTRQWIPSVSYARVIPKEGEVNDFVRFVSDFEESFSEIVEADAS